MSHHFQCIAKKYCDKALACRRFRSDRIFQAALEFCQLQKEMIVTSPGISASLADTARTSLDKEVSQIRNSGKLEAGGRTSERIGWTKETHSAAQEFEKNIDLSLLKDIGIIAIAKPNIKWTGPIIFSDVSPNALRYDKSGPGNGYLGLVALGRLQLPEYGDSGSKSIASGDVAYFRESDPVVYRSCGGGRGILFYISMA